MAIDKTVRDIMDDIFEYPHLPYWFTVKQAIGIIKKLLPESGLCLYPRAVLIFDEKYNLLGSLAIKDILRGLEPKMADSPEAGPSSEDDKEFWDSLFGSGCRELANRPVSEIMLPATIFLGPEDSISKAAYMMVKNERICLPVLENKKKLVGIVKLAKVFDALSDIVLKK